jgi:hypothetical protein
MLTAASYIMNRGWLDRHSKHIPTHDEVLEAENIAAAAKAAKAHAKAAAVAYQPLHEDDSDFDERAEDFENRYNFRFEEPCVRHVSRIAFVDIPRAQRSGRSHDVLSLRRRLAPSTRHCPR